MRLLLHLTRIDAGGSRPRGRRMPCIAAPRMTVHDHAAVDDGRARGRGPVQATVRFFDLCLRGASQVFFQDNPVTGALLLTGILWAAAAGGTLRVGIGAVAGLVVGTGVAMLLRSDEAARGKGMFGFNPLLVGVAVPTFLEETPTMWIYLVIGAAAAHVVTLALGSLLQPYGVAASTGPFVLATWLLLLGAYGFLRTPSGGLPAPALPHAIHPAAADVAITPSFLVSTVFCNVSQVFLVKSVVAGALFVVGIAYASARAALFALGGSAVAIITSLALGADGADLARGLLGFSPVLTSLALGAVYLRPSPRVTIYALFGTVFCVIIQGALGVLLRPYGIPTLTMPYVLTMWLFTLSKSDVALVSHSEPKRDPVHPVFAERA